MLQNPPPAKPPRSAANSQKARASYRHGDLKRALTDAAVALAREAGPAAITLREATRRAGVVPTAAYRHFANHQALFDEVRRVALANLAQTLQRHMRAASRGVRGANRARQRFLALGRGYIYYALSEPGMFRTAFWAQPYDLSEEFTQSLVRSGLADPFAVLQGALADLVEHKLLPPSAREYAAFLAWSGVHGMALLLLDGPLRFAKPAERKALIEGVTAMIEAGLSQATMA